MRAWGWRRRVPRCALPAAGGGPGRRVAALERREAALLAGLRDVHAAAAAAAAEAGMSL